jgi:hypothetical protein
MSTRKSSENTQRGKKSQSTKSGRRGGLKRRSRKVLSRKQSHRRLSRLKDSDLHKIQKEQKRSIKRYQRLGRKNFQRLHDATQRASVYPKRTGDVFVIGDLHGDLDMAKHVLATCGLVRKTYSGNMEWVGGTSMCVQLGDILDRGPSSKSMIRFFMDLERQAFDTGGLFVMTLGNHELMNLFGVTRYASPDDDREWGLEVLHKYTDNEMRGSGREQFDEGRRQKFRNSPEGQWLAKQPLVVRIATDIFAHGDPRSVVDAQLRLDDTALLRLNNELLQLLEKNRRSAQMNRHELHALMLTFPNVFNTVWSRVLAESPSEVLCPLIEKTLTLSAQGTGPLLPTARRIFVGHTVQIDGHAHARCDGKVNLVDTGLSMYSHSLSAPNTARSWQRVYGSTHDPQVVKLSIEQDGRAVPIDVPRLPIVAP